MRVLRVFRRIVGAAAKSGHVKDPLRGVTIAVWMFDQQNSGRNQLPKMISQAKASSKPSGDGKTYEVRYAVKK